MAGTWSGSKATRKPFSHFGLGLSPKLLAIETEATGEDKRASAAETTGNTTTADSPTNLMARCTRMMGILVLDMPSSIPPF